MSSTKYPRRGFRIRRLSTGLLLAFLSLSILPIVVVTATSALREIRVARAEATRHLAAHAEAVEETLNNWVETSGNSLIQFASDPSLRATVAQLMASSAGSEAFAEASSAFNSRAGVVVETGALFNRFALLDESGYVLGSDDPQLLQLGVSLEGEGWFRSAMEVTTPDTVVLSGMLRDPVDGQESLYFSVPVLDSATGRARGVISGRVSPEQLENILETSIPLGALGETGEYYLVREGRRYVAAPRLGPDLEIATGDIVGMALGGQEGTGAWRDYRGNEVLGAYRWVDQLGMATIVKQDVDEVLSESRALVQTNLLVGTLVGLVALVTGVIISRRIVAPLEELSDTATRIAHGNLDLLAPEGATIELRQLGDAFNRMTNRLRTLITTQEGTIKARTRELEATARIGRAIAAETNLEYLLSTTVEQIRNYFGYYHVQIFLLDDLRQYAVLRASTGEIGQQLLAQGHKLPVGSQSVIGQATSQDKPILARDTDTSPVHRRNELLPETRAEVAIPIHIGRQMIGALDVQSVEPEAFDEGTIAALETVADHLAVAIRNVQLFEEKESLLSASLQLTQTLTRDTWDSYLGKQSGVDALGFQYDLSDVRPLDLKTGGGGPGDGRELALPIALRGEIIGQLEAQLTEDRRLSEEDRQLVGEILGRMALALENARLFEQTQASLMETNRLYEASQRIAAADSVPELVTELLSVSVIDSVDRVALALLEDPDQPLGERVVEVAGKWAREGKDIFNDLPDHLPVGEAPLMGLEEADPDGTVINDVESAELAEDLKANLTKIKAKSSAVFPLIAGRRTLAWLVLQSTRQANAFSEEDVRFFEVIADQAASALDGLRLLEQTQTRARRLQAINEVSRAASSILNVDILLPLVTEQIRDAFGYYHAQVFLNDDQNEYASLRASTGEIGKELLQRGHKLAVGSRSVIGQVTAIGEPVIARDTDTDPIHRRNELLPNTRAEMALPLRIGGRVIGALDVQSVHPNAFDPEAQVILQSLADEISVTLENAQLFQEIQDRVAELTTVNLVSQAISRTQTLEDLYDVVTTQLQRTFDADYGFLGVLDKEDMIHLPVFIEGGERIESPTPQPLGQGLTSIVIQSREMLIINENAEEMAQKLGARVIGTMPRSVLIAPLLIGDEIIGVISIQDADKEFAYGEAHIRQLTTLAAYIAIKIRNAELLEEAQQRVSELSAINDMAQVVSRADTMEDLYDVIVDQVEKNFGTSYTSLSVLGSDNMIHVPLFVSEGERLTSVEPMPLSQGLSGYVIRNKETLYFGEDVGNKAKQYGVVFVHDPPRAKSMLFAPLMLGDEAVGAIGIQDVKRERAYSESHVRFLETFAAYLAVKVRNAQLFEETQRRVSELSAINDMAQAVSRADTLDDLYDVIVDQVEKNFGTSREQAVMLAELGSDNLIQIPIYIEEGERKPPLGPLELGQGVIGYVLQNKETLYVPENANEVTQQLYGALEVPDSPPVSCVLFTPLMLGDEALGVIGIQHTSKERAYSEAHVRFLETFAAYLAVKIRNAQLLEEAQSRVAELTATNTMAQAVSRAQELDDLYEVVADQLQRVLGTKDGYLGIVDEKGMLQLPFLISEGERVSPPEPRRYDRGLSKHVIDTGETLLINENISEVVERLGAVTLVQDPPRVKSLLISPLVLGDEVLGIVSIQDLERERAYTEAHVRQLNTLAAYLAVKIRNAELLEEARRRAADLGFLFNVTRAAVATTDLGEALQNVAEILNEEIPDAEAAVIYLTHPSGEYLEPQAAVGYGRDAMARQEHVAWGSGMVGVAAANGRSLIVADTREVPYHTNGNAKTRSAVLVPLKTGQEVTGVLSIESSRPGAFGEHELRLLETASGTLNAIVQNARLLEQITRANEELRELDMLKRQFLANMSHELRTPLNSIIGFSRVMLKGIDGPLNDLQSQDLTTIYQSGQHLLGLINDILDLSKIEAGKMEIQPEYISLEEIIDGVMSSGRGLVKDKPIQIFKEVESELPLVYGDPVRVRQVLLNLVANAAKFTHEGHIIIRAGRRPYDPETGDPPRVQIEVEDTGIGIAPEDMEKLFEPFSQVDGSTTRQAGGTGLGLAISSQFIELHRGRMWVESDLGKGSRFYFTIPLHPQTEDSPDMIATASYDDGRPVILAVDDEPGVLELYCRYLEKEGYAVVGLSNANDLAQRVRDVRPAAIIIDLNLPGTSGWDAINKLREADDTGKVPLVICSIDDERQRGQALGIDEYLVKPIIEDDLLGSLERAMNQAAGDIYKVLIIDGDEKYAQTVEVVLTKSGQYTTEVVTAGYEGLEAIMKETPDAIILDLDLPDMDGYGLLTSLRAQDGTRRIPAVILTAREISQEDFERLDGQVTQYLNKGDYAEDQLLDGLYAVLNGI